MAGVPLRRPSSGVGLNTSSGWHVTTLHGSADDLHARPFPETSVPTIWLMAPTGAAVVLGSGQRDVVLDPAAVEAALGRPAAVARRRSGGGAVLIEPENTVWVDVLIPQQSAAWDDDLGATFLRVGEAWAAACGDVGVGSVMVRRRPQRTDLSDAVCFAGAGWGELMRSGVEPPAKLVGLSQRRTRWGARVQGMAVRGPTVHRLAPLFGFDLGVDAGVDPAVDATVDAGVDPGVEPGEPWWPGDAWDRLPAAVVGRLSAMPV